MIEMNKWFADRLITDNLNDDRELSPIFGYLNQPLVSLEKSLEPVEKQIEGLHEYIQIAKERCHYPNKHGLSKDQSAAIYLYTMEWGNNSFYRILNTVLRNSDRNALKSWFSFLKLFDTALKLLPMRKQNVWRGIRAPSGKECKKGNELIWWSVNSCSIDVHVIEQFLATNSTLFLIEAVTARDITGYTNYPQEHEVILQPGIKLHIVANSMEHTGGLHVVHLREIKESKSWGIRPSQQQLLLTKAKGNIRSRCNKKRIIVISSLFVFAAIVLGVTLGLTKRRTEKKDHTASISYSADGPTESTNSTVLTVTAKMNVTNNTTWTPASCRSPVTGFLVCNAFSHTYSCPSIECSKISVVYGCSRYPGECFIIGQTVIDGDQRSDKWFRIKQKNGSDGYVSSLYCEAELPEC